MSDEHDRHPEQERPEPEEPEGSEPQPSGSEPEPSGSEAQRPRVPIKVRDKRVLSSEADAEQEVLEQESVSGHAAQTADELGEAHRLADDRLDQLKRLKADFENFRKRVIREQTELVERASLRIVERLLPVLDDVERALEAARKHEGAEGIVRGVELVFQHLHDVLVSEGLERLEAEGSPFDPHEHEAVSSVPGDVDEPTVLEVVRPGYRLKGKTVRPALVHVTTPSAETEEEPEEGGE